MRDQSVEVEVQTVTGKDGQAASSEALTQPADNAVGGILISRPEAKDRDQLHDRVKGQPQLEGVIPTAQPSADLVQLDVGEAEVLEADLVEDLAVASRPT